jgi:hypothetical protein
MCEVADVFCSLLVMRGIGLMFCRTSAVESNYVGDVVDLGIVFLSLQGCWVAVGIELQCCLGGCWSRVLLRSVC